MFFLGQAKRKGRNSTLIDEVVAAKITKPENEACSSKSAQHVETDLNEIDDDVDLLNKSVHDSNIFIKRFFKLILILLLF